MRKFYGPQIPGSISPVPATDDMTEPVGIRDGQLWTRGPDGGLESRVEVLEDNVGDLETDVGGLDGRMDDAESDISAIDQAINGVGGIDDRLEAAENTLSTATGDIAQLQYDLGDVRIDIGALYNTKVDEPADPGSVGDVLVLSSGGATEWQPAAPFDPTGTYPGVTVGKAVTAKSLENVSEDSGATQDEPFFFQATATANNTAETPTAPTFELKKLKGNTIVYNMLVDGVNPGVVTISGHKYWVYITATDYTGIVTSAGSPIILSDPQLDKVVDLTRWFNGSIPQEILDDPTIFPINYYDGDLTYSAGELKSCDCTELKTVGFNLFDKDSVVVGYVVNDSTGNLSPSSGNNASDWIRIPMGMKLYQNVSFVGNYLAFYDIRKQYISGIGSHVPGILNTPENACYIRITVDDAHLDTMNLNLHWDGERDGEYEPYVSHTYPMVWSGKSAGSVYDERLPDGTEHIRILGINLGTISTWYTYTGGNSNTYYAVLPTTMASINAICSRYVVSSVSETNLGDKSMRLRTSGNYIFIRDTDYANATDFKNAMSGVILYYEVSETTSSGDAFTSVIEGDDYGVMSFDSVVPVGNEFFYPADYALLIDDLNNYVNGDVTELMRLSDFPIPSPVGLADGTYKLVLTVSGGTNTLSWESDS